MKKKDTGLIDLKTLKVGDAVEFARSYPLQGKNRFPGRWNKEIVEEPTPIKDGAGKGCVVGVRSVVMSGYKLGVEYHDEGGSSCYASGKCEQVLQVAKSIYHKPVLVRFSDVTAVEVRPAGTGAITTHKSGDVETAHPAQLLLFDDYEAN